MMVQTWTILPTISWQHPVTGSHFIKFAHKLNHIFYSPGTCIWSEIFRLVFLHSSGKKNSGIFLIYCDFDKRITLIIFEHGIIFRSVLLDQITLQHKGFQFRICDNILKSGDMGNHLFNLCALISAALEILTHPVFQTDGFSNIDDLVLLPMHNINPRLTRKFFQFFFYLKHKLSSIQKILP